MKKKKKKKKIPKLQVYIVQKKNITNRAEEQNPIQAQNQTHLIFYYKT